MMINTAFLVQDILLHPQELLRDRKIAILLFYNKQQSIAGGILWYGCCADHKVIFFKVSHAIVAATQSRVYKHVRERRMYVKKETRDLILGETMTIWLFNTPHQREQIMVYAAQ